MNETTAFAIYRLPHQQQCVLVDQIGGLPRELPSCAELCGCEGFVMAPFAPSADCPILLLRPDRVYTFACADHVKALIPVDSVENIESQIEPQPFSHADYQVDFANFHEHLVNGEFSKLVLSRSVDIKRKPGLTAISLFAEACRRYPRVMVALVSTPQAGTWLTATPEILLSGSGRFWQTMALAGTMPYSDKVRWSDKNIQISPNMVLARCALPIWHICAAISISPCRIPTGWENSFRHSIPHRLYVVCPRMRLASLSLPTSITTVVIIVVSWDRCHFTIRPISMSPCAACNSSTVIVAFMPVVASCQKVTNSWNGRRPKRNSTLCVVFSSNHCL